MSCRNLPTRASSRLLAHWRSLPVHLAVASAGFVRKCSFPGNNALPLGSRRLSCNGKHAFRSFGPEVACMRHPISIAASFTRDIGVMSQAAEGAGPFAGLLVNGTAPRRLSGVQVPTLRCYAALCLRIRLCQTCCRHIRAACTTCELPCT